MKKFTRIIMGLLLVLGLALTVLVGLSWAPDRPVEELAQRWAKPPSEFVRVQGMNVHYRDEGPRDGPTPLVLLHGTSASLHTWNGWTEALQDDRRVVRFDLPGFGLTGPFPGDDYSVERYVDFIVAMLDELELDRVVLGGNSFGGQLAWETALAAPQRVEKLVLVDAGGYPLDPEDMPIGFKVAQMPGMEPVMAHLLPRAMIESSVRDVYGDPDQVTEALVDRYYELTLREGNRRALIRRFQAMNSQDPGASRIANIDIPTLIIWGDKDRLIPPESAERFAADIDNSILVRFESLGHVPQEESPNRTAGAVRQFLEKDS